MNQFVNIVGEMGKGLLLPELGEKLTEVVAGVREHRGKGSLTLKISVSPVRNMDNAITLSAEIETKIPKAEPANSLFYADDENGLHRRDPNQQELEFEREMKAQEAQAQTPKPEERKAAINE